MKSVSWAWARNANWVGEILRFWVGKILWFQLRFFLHVNVSYENDTNFFVFVWKWKAATLLSSWSIFCLKRFWKSCKESFLERGSREIISTFIHSLVNEAVDLFQAFEKMFCFPTLWISWFQREGSFDLAERKNHARFFNEDRHENLFFFKSTILWLAYD